MNQLVSLADLLHLRWPVPSPPYPRGQDSSQGWEPGQIASGKLRLELICGCNLVFAKARRNRVLGLPVSLSTCPSPSDSGPSRVL